MAVRFDTKEIAEIYFQHRPNYPNEIYDKILGYLDEGRHTAEEKLRKVAVDVGCGSGQNTRALAKYFDTVIGIDSSETQLEEARKSSSSYSNISFVNGTANDLSAILKDHQCGGGRVDLVTAAAALHWLDAKPFFEECLQILRPDGVLAAFGYETPRLDNSEANHLLQTFTRETLIDYWHPSITNYLWDHYQELYQILTRTFPKCQRVGSILLPFKQSINEFTGFVSSICACLRYKELNPQILNPLEELQFQTKLEKIFSPSSSSSSSSGEPVVRGYFDMFMIMGKKI